MDQIQAKVYVEFSAVLVAGVTLTLYPFESKRIYFLAGQLACLVSVPMYVL